MQKNEANHYLKPRPPVHAYLDITKRDHSGSGLTFKENWHEEMQFYYICKGSALLRCESVAVELAAGDIGIINSNELHSLINTGRKLSCYIIRLDTALLLNQTSSDYYSSLLARQLIAFKHLARHDQRLVQILRTILTEDEKRQSGFELAIQAAVLHLLAELVRHYLARIYTPERLETRLNSMHQLKRVITSIDAHYQEPLSVSELARQALMSESHFCRTFKKIYGQTLVHYINTLRLEKAEELLRDPATTITEVALSVGFSDANYFSRLFKREKGIAPQKFKKQLLGTKSQ
ncbi:helix-turn-helix domain-containing protein [Sporolactobacillus spathodeae]|uniref:AraC-like DNA-binding protein n=1 Tax=Sporolactobacillus spathodeae TaxID=1465502 RepID=A0ABS2Q7D2_9BACL|nr:AraC family transcriptional regulator [Sporolactobacillus spathodeae]MBM7657506.1 AraC-like DNA-binding protein [Sporolactobacillus spathodeae]